MVDLASNVFNYNLPPWLVTKRFFVILSLIISGPENVKVANFDVYLEPMIEELKELWKGVAGLDILHLQVAEHLC